LILCALEIFLLTYLLTYANKRFYVIKFLLRLLRFNVIFIFSNVFFLNYCEKLSSSQRPLRTTTLTRRSKTANITTD